MIDNELPYEILGRLGEGATGIVYEARRRSDPDGPHVALKVIHPELLSDPQIRGRFEREAAILRRLDGQHLCPILDFGAMPDPVTGATRLLYIALPKLDGESLDRVLARGPLPLSRVMHLFAQICAALDEAHRRGVIHRDLKPQNVIVGPDDHVTVVDFGMAKIVTGAGTGTTALTQHNMVFGTPEYMAPEQARGDDLDHRCDIYAAGVMLYEMLTGAVPFSGPTPLTVLTAVMTTAASPPSQRAPERAIPAALEAVVLAAMAKAPENRYPDASSLCVALVHAAANPTDADGVRPASLAPMDGPVDGHALTIVGPPPPLMPTALGLEAGLGTEITENALQSVARAPSPSPSPRAASRPSPTVDASARRTTMRIVTAPPRSNVTLLLLWIIAAVAGVGVGVYLSLRTR